MSVVYVNSFDVTALIEAIYDTASPFIMENDELMDGWRPNPDSGSSALD